MVGVKYVFVEQRAPAGVEENEVTLAFEAHEPAWGRGWLTAVPGCGGVPPGRCPRRRLRLDREPLQLFEEFTAQITRAEPDFERELSTLDEKLGAGFVQNLTRRSGPKRPGADGILGERPDMGHVERGEQPRGHRQFSPELVETFNAELGPDEQGKRIVLEQESAGGRTWSTMKPGGLPLGITWTYDRGYLVAASDRGVAERAIATRNGGSPLVWSPEFLGQLPSSAGSTRRPSPG